MPANLRNAAVRIVFYFSESCPKVVLSPIGAKKEQAQKALALFYLDKSSAFICAAAFSFAARRAKEAGVP